VRRLGAARHLCGIAVHGYPGLSAALAALAVFGALQPAVLALATGSLVRAASDGSSLLWPASAFAGMVALPMSEARWRVAEQLGMRVGDVLDQRLMEATLSPPGLSHLDDPGVRDELTRATTFWNSSLLEGLVSVTVVRLSGIAAAVVFASQAGVGPALLVAAAWVGSGWWSWRVASRALDVQFDKAPELREVEYISELALSPAAGKDVRVYGLGPWFVQRQFALWSAAMEPLWAGRRRQFSRSVLVAAGVAGAHLVAVSALLGRQPSVAEAATAVTALLAMAGLGEIPFGHYEMEFGLRTVPANAAVATAVREERFALPGHAPADGLPQRGIRLEKVGFTYPRQSSEVLREVDLELAAGTSTAIVGVNGAGKSTLVKLLCRFYDPTSGRITVDGIDLREIDPQRWQERVAGLFQDFVRYPLSARDNIALNPQASTDADDELEEVLAAAELAGIADELLALPDGIDTLVTRGFGGGQELSGGQWQRLALARAIFAVRRGAGLLVLDEPTAHLDARAESNLYDRFLEVTQGVTTILVSHRFSTVRRADRIAVIDAGLVTEHGTHDELVDLGGTYARLFRLQAATFQG
jgi:ATP-binding cassette, subfamily B, bacterial